MEIKFTIPLVPVTKKNSQRIIYNPRTKRNMIIPSSAYKQYEKDAIMFLKGVIAEPIDYPINIKELFYMPTRRLVDKLNLQEAIDDIMVKAGVIKDDNSRIVAGHDGSRVKYDKENPRTEITITELKD